MTRPADELSSLHYLDARDYRLVVLVDNDGAVEIGHQRADDQTATRDMTRLAAEIVDQVGPRAVADALGADEVAPEHLVRGVVVTPPPPGKHVMPCRCGRMLSAHDMRRAAPRYGMAGPVIAPITCERCSLS